MERDTEHQPGTTTCCKNKRVEYVDEFRILRGDNKVIKRIRVNRTFSCPIAEKASNNFSPELQDKWIKEGRLCKGCDMMNP